MPRRHDPRNERCRRCRRRNFRPRSRLRGLARHSLPGGRGWRDSSASRAPGRWRFSTQPVVSVGALLAPPANISAPAGGSKRDAASFFLIPKVRLCECALSAKLHLDVLGRFMASSSDASCLLPSFRESEVPLTEVCAPNTSLWERRERQRARNPISGSERRSRG